MLKYDKIIHRFTLEEKIDLLISRKKLANQNVKSFNFPTFEINEGTTEASRNFSKYSTLATTWNTKLIFNAAVNRGKYLRSLKAPRIVGVPLTVKTIKEYEAFASEQYLVGKFAASYVNGLNQTGVYSAYTNFPGYLGSNEVERRNNLLASEISIKNSKADVVVLNDISNVRFINDEIKYEGYKMVETSEYAKAFYNGCKFILSCEDPKEKMIEAIDNYKKSKAELQNGLISIVDFEELERQGTIFNPDRLDLLLDEYFEFINNFDANCNYADLPFEESNVDKVVSQQSIILMKNENVLPLDRKAPTIMIGNWAIESDGNTLTPYNHAKTLDLEINGCAHGYTKVKLDKKKLLNEALEMCGEATHALVFLTTYESKNKAELPPDQVKVLKALHEKELKVIAVLHAPGAVLSNFYEYCDAVIQVTDKSKDTVESLFSVISGEINPSGKTTWYNPVSLETPVDKNDNGTYTHPLGHGLSYTLFEYSNITCNESGVQFTLTNKGYYDGHEVAMLYVKLTNNEGKDLYYELRGFEKVFLKSKEAMRVTIPFDDYTFQVFNEEKNCYEVISGTYQLFINSNADYTRLKVNLKVKGKLLDENGFENVGLEESNQTDEVLTEFQETLSRKYFIEEMKELGFGKKLTIGILVYVYFNLFSIFLFAVNLANDKLVVMFILSIMLFIASQVVFVLFLVKEIEKRNKLQAMTSNEKLLEVAENMNEYDELTKVTYPVPVEAVEEEIGVIVEEIEVIEEENEEETEEEVAEGEEVMIDENKKAFIDEGFAEYIEHEEFANNVDLPRYVTTFVEYVSHHGIIIEPKSARALLSALGSTHMLILRSMNNELLPRLMSLLSNYLLSQDMQLDMSEVKTSDDLFWKEVSEDQYERTELAKLVYAATQMKKTINLAVLNNVELRTFKETYGKIYKFINNPNGEYTVNLGTKEKPLEVKIPKNLIFIVIANEDNYLEEIDKEVAEVSLSIELVLRKNEIEVEINDKVTYLSYNGLVELVKENREQHIIEEAVWKKIDDFEEEINNLEYFRVENKTILDFEKFVGLMVEEGADVDEAIDVLFSSRIIPILKSYKIYKNNNGDTAIFEIIDRIFGAENMPMTKRAINKPM